MDEDIGTLINKLYVFIRYLKRRTVENPSDV